MSDNPILFLDSINRVLKTFHAYIFTSKNLLKDYIEYFENKGYNWDLLIMAKNNPIPTKNNKYLSDKEYIFFVREKGCYFNNDLSYDNYFSVKRINVTKNIYHPTEKKISLIKSLILMSSKENDLIIDPFMGSWTTALACRELKRDFIGAELSEEYCQIGKNRLAQKILI